MEGTHVGIITTITSITVSTAAGVALALAATTGITPAEASPIPYANEADTEPEPQTWCQWSYEPNGKVIAYGNDIQAWRFKIRGTGTVKVGTVSEDALKPYGDRTWITIKFSRIAEDDVRKVSCKVAGKWREAEPS